MLACHTLPFKQNHMIIGVVLVNLFSLTCNLSPFFLQPSDEKSHPKLSCCTPSSASETGLFVPSALNKF